MILTPSVRNYKVNSHENEREGIHKVCSHTVFPEFNSVVTSTVSMDSTKQPLAVSYPADWRERDAMKALLVRHCALWKLSCPLACTGQPQALLGITCNKGHVCSDS